MPSRHLLVEVAAVHPESNAAQRAVGIALEARALAPEDAGALVVLAKAYQAAGRPADAQNTARHARLVAPEYATQTLGSLGLSTTTTP